MARTNKTGTYKYDLDHLPPIYFVPEALPDEEFAMITDQAAPNVLPYYAISTYGRVWHVFENKFISSTWDDCNYRIVILRTKNNGTPRTFRVHRLLMLTFRYDEYLQMCKDHPGEEVVEHVDNCKTRNYINFPGKPDNLKHLVSGEKHGMNVYSEEQIRKCCEFIAAGAFTNRQLGELVRVPTYVIENIRYGHCWQAIAKEYGIK